MFQNNNIIIIIFIIIIFINLLLIILAFNADSSLCSPIDLSLLFHNFWPIASLVAHVVRPILVENVR